MTLDEAIKHCEEVAEEQEKYCPTQPGKRDEHAECAAEHRQLAEWLKELKEYSECKRYWLVSVNCDGIMKPLTYPFGREGDV